MSSSIIFNAILCVSFLSTLALAGDPCVPQWDVSIGQPGMTGSYVSDFLAYDDGSGPGQQLYAAGQFDSAGGQPANLIAKLVDDNWQPVGGGLSNQFANDMEIFNGKLFVAGYFDSAGSPPSPNSAKIACWDGQQWEGIDAQLEFFTNSLWALQSWDDGAGEDLYIGGNYTDIGGSTFDYISRFDGQTFTEVGGTIGGAGIPLIVLHLDIFDGDLIAGGRFATIDEVNASHIARWDGDSWHPLGAGIGGTQVLTMEIFDDGNGPALFVGGSFSQAGGANANNIAKWDGQNWTSLTTGTDASVQNMAVYDDGSGEALYVVGNFETAGGVTVNRIARWDGQNWSAVGEGFDDTAFGSYVFDNGEGPALYTGGNFSTADNMNANRVARYVGCPDEGPSADLNNDGTVDGADLGILLGEWNASDSIADLNEDGTVDGADLGILLGAWE